MKEQVLVFPAHVLPHFSGVLTDPHDVENILGQALSPNNLVFVYRDLAETDESVKQVIPYCVVFNTKGEVLVYRRTKKVGEQRLSGKYSIGIGGHINPVDGCAGNVAYTTGLAREIQEELALDSYSCEPCYAYHHVGVLYDPSDEVGRVHFGVVNAVWLCETTTATLNDETLTELQWVEPGYLEYLPYEFENWSRILINDGFLGKLKPPYAEA